MSEPEINPTDRVGNKLKAEVAELTRVVKKILESIQDYEKETGEPFMREGDYLGISFKD